MSEEVDDFIVRRARAIPGVAVIDTRGVLKAFKRMNSSPALQQHMRMERDRTAMQKVANRERRIALLWLDDRMDAMYADLGLQR